MNKHVRVIASILMLLAFGSLLTWPIMRWLARGQSQQEMNARIPLPEPYTQVDEKASAARGADEGAIRELADAVLLLVVEGRLPSVIVIPFKERLVRAEINYRSGRKAGIPEANIVRVIDELAEKLNAPKYARTDEDEVRDTRLAISYMMPNFIVRQPLNAGEEPTMGFSYTVNPLMGPLEAVYVTRDLLKQKEINKFSQITSEERAEVKIAINKLRDKGIRLTWQERGQVIKALIEQKLYPEKPQLTAEELAKWSQQQSIEQAKNQTTAYFLSAGPSTSRYKEMETVFHRAYTMKVSDALALTNRSLELLGIEN